MSRPASRGTWCSRRDFKNERRVVRDMGDLGEGGKDRSVVASGQSEINSGLAPRAAAAIVPAQACRIKAIMYRPQSSRLVAGLLLAVVPVGCGTTRMTDSPRAATEMLLVSQAADNAVAQIDFTPLTGKTVFLDSTGIDKDIIDKGYLVSLVKQQLVAAGALLYDEKTRAEYVVDLRVGGLGTDRQSVLVGTPAVQLPSVVPGLPTNIPELAFMKKSDQRGIAKVAVFAYNRISGRAIWQSGTAEANTHVKDTWLFGAGPFSRGTIRKQTELAGEPLPTIPMPFQGTPKRPVPAGPTAEQFYPNYLAPVPPPVVPAGLLGVTGAAALTDRPVVR